MAAYDLTGFTYWSNSFDLSYEAEPRIWINDAGTKLFVSGSGADQVREYTLSTAYDLSSASLTNTDSTTFAAAGSWRNPSNIFLKADGTKLYVTTSFEDKVGEFPLSTAFDLSTIGSATSLSVGTQTTIPQGLFISSDGTKLFVVGIDNSDVFRYTMTTGWDLSTASFDSGQVFSTNETFTGARDVWFKPDGTKMYLTSTSTGLIYQFGLTTAWDLTTASYDSVTLDVSSQSPVTLALAFADGGNHLFVSDDTNTAVYRFSQPQPVSQTVDLRYSAEQAVSQTLRLDYDLQATSSPTITNVSPSSFGHGATNVVVTGTNFGASQGTSTLDIGGVVQTGLTWTDTQITIPTVDLTGVPIGTNWLRVDVN